MEFPYLSQANNVIKFIQISKFPSGLIADSSCFENNVGYHYRARGETFFALALPTK